MTRALLTLVCLSLALPVLGVLGSWLALDAAALDTLVHQAQTVLPRYAAQSLVLMVGVGVGVIAVGGASAAVIALCDFPGRNVFAWALLLPLAMPAYVLAYAYTDFLQFSGPLQVALRDWTGWQGALWPDVRSLGGAVVLFILCLYPYVYLLTRAALAERGVHLMEAARMLGASPRRRVWAIALPLARPALAAGLALALMETLADYGVSAYFGLDTFSTGIYKAWMVLNSPAAAAQLASLLLALVATLLWLERRAQRRLRFALSRSGATHTSEARAVRLRGSKALAAVLVCAVPVLLGFVIPVGVLLAMLAQEATHAEIGLPLARFWQWGLTSFKLAALSALLAAGFSLLLAHALRVGAGERSVLVLAGRVVSLGYAVPGVVIAVGILLPLAALQQVWPQFPLGAAVTGTVFGLVFAYLSRFSAVALQTLEAGYARVPRSLDDTARTLGASRWRIFHELHLPLLRRSALVAALLVFVDVMKELPATLLLRPFDSDTLAVVAFNLARDERLGEAALPALAIVLVGLAPVLLLSRALNREVVKT